MRASWQLDTLSEPVGEPGLVHLMSCDCQHGQLGIIDVGGIGRPGDPVQVEEEDEHGPG